jgi:hypothetical protein
MRGGLHRHGMRGWTRKKGGGNDTRVGLLLPDRARWECARSTDAVRPDTSVVPEEDKRASVEGSGWSLMILCARATRGLRRLAARA